MAITECRRCGIGKLPWRWVESLGGNVCFDCSFIVWADEQREKDKVDKKIGNIAKDGSKIE